MKKLIIPFIILLVIIVLLFIPKQKIVYSENFFYMDTYIEVKLYNISKTKATKTFDNINQIYKEYHNLSDKFSSYNVTNIFDINNGLLEGDKVQIDEKLYNLIKYGVDWYDKSNGLLNISMGELTSLWKKYQQNKNGIPTKKELNSIKFDITDVKLLDNNYILNNKPNIDLGSIAKGYATEEVGKYLKNSGIKQFLINAGGNVLTGDYYESGKYKIGIEDPTDNSNVYQIVKGNNIAVVTSGGYLRYYEYDGKTYSHIINPNTLMPANNMKSVTIVTSDSALGDALSTTLYLMTIEEGKEFIKNYDAEAIWYGIDGTISKTEGFSKYE